MNMYKENAEMQNQNKNHYTRTMNWYELSNVLKTCETISLTFESGSIHSDGEKTHNGFVFFILQWNLKKI